MSTTPPDSESQPLLDEAALERLQLHLGRLQLALPLTLLIFIAASLIGQLVAKPSLSAISDEYLTILTPSTGLIGAYWLVILVLVIGQCLLAALARKTETKQTFVSGLGMRMPLFLVLMSLWVLFWCLRIFLASWIVLMLAFITIFSIWGTLLWYPISGRRPLDYVFTHAPARMLLCIIFSIDIWQNGLLALGWYRYFGDEPEKHHGHWEKDHAVHSWAAFGVVFGVALINSAIVFVWRDVVYALSHIYLAVALAYQSDSKPPQVFITIILGAALVLVSLLSSIGYAMLKADREGAIRLEEEEEEAAAQQ